MFKKCFLLLGAAAVWMLSVGNLPSSYAKTPSQVSAMLPEFPITMNGSVVDNKHSMYPLLVYKDITYFPMTYHYTTSLGLVPDWNATEGLSIRNQPGCQPLQQDLTSEAVQEQSDAYTATLVPFPVKVNGQPIVNEQEQYPLLFFRDIVYFPMTWAFTHDAFGWTTSWDAEHGLRIAACDTASSVNTEQQTTALNIAGGGQLAVQGEWIYMNPVSKYFGPNSLVRMKSDGSEKQTISDDNAMSINAVGDWLYYTSWDPSTSNYQGIIRVKTDGTERSVVASIPTTRIWVKDGWIYYIKLDQISTNPEKPSYRVSGIHKMRLDGSDDTAVVEGEGSFTFYIDGDDIFFLKQDKRYAPDSLFKVKTDGSGLKKLQDEVGYAPVVIDGWIYYYKGDYNGKVMHKMDREGTIDIELFTSDQWMNSFQYHDGWIYFIKGTFGLMGTAYIEKVRIDGTGHTALTAARATSLYVAGNDLYYPSAFDGDKTLRAIPMK